jgi:hypothetical protein
MSRTEINRACGAGKRRPEYFADRAPSPSQGEGWGEGEHSQARLRMPVSNRPLAMPLKELLAARLSPQAGKSTVIYPRGEGNGVVCFGRAAKKPI